jgi:L-threonylcarbamoyladenylate synthase
VLDLTTDPALILRPGAITREMLSEVIGRVDRATTADDLGRSPGTRHRHYSPNARVILMEGKTGEQIEQLCRQYIGQGAVGFIGHTLIEIDHPNFKSIILEGKPEAYAHSIYSALRELDRPGTNAIIVEGISEEGAGAAVMDRLRRAASEVVD